MKKTILILGGLFCAFVSNAQLILNQITPTGYCGVGTGVLPPALSSPKAYLQIHGTTNYALNPPQLGSAEIPPLYTIDFGSSSTFLMTNQVCGREASDGTIFHQSQNDFYLHNQEENGTMAFQTNGNLSLRNNGTSLLLRASTGEIDAGNTFFNIQTQRASFNMFASQQNGLNIRTTNSSNYGLAIQTPNNSKAIKVVDGSGQTNFLVTSDGLIRAREIKVDLLNPWPDYVFEPNYQLMPLNLVASYITQNKHLPNVPSAQEIEENGVNLGEMDKILLQKIEELTLYIIEQENRIKALEEEIKTKK